LVKFSRAALNMPSPRIKKTGAIMMRRKREIRLG
jgi:hypothetical protein